MGQWQHHNKNRTQLMRNCLNLCVANAKEVSAVTTGQLLMCSDRVFSWHNKVSLPKRRTTGVAVLLQPKWANGPCAHA